MNLAPDDASSDWRSAATALRDHLLKGEGPDGDCRTVSIWLGADGAIMFFTTRDGRQAVRRLRSPAELAPIVDALRVTLPTSAPPEDPPVTEPAPAEDRVSPASPGRVASASANPIVSLQLTAGGRLGFPGVFASPSFSFRAGIVLRSWELGAFAQWDPAHGLVGEGAPPAFSMSRYAAGISVGRRAPLGPGAVVLGVASSVAAIQESGGEDESQSMGPSTARASSAALPILGAYLALLSGQRFGFRARAELSADAVINRVNQPISLDDSLPPVPWWSALLSGGVDWEVP